MMTPLSIFFRFLAISSAISLFSIGLSGCHCKSHIRAQSDYLGHHSLASYYVGTPDPLLDAPPLGQRLIISWSFPTHYFKHKDLHLETTFRYRNREESSETFDLQGHPKGFLVYAITGEEYFEKQGILTYQVNLIGDGQILETVKHQLWVNLITLNTENTAIKASADIQIE